MDFATLFGILGGFGLVIAAILVDGAGSTFFNAPSSSRTLERRCFAMKKATSSLRRIFSASAFFECLSCFKVFDRQYKEFACNAW